MNWKNFVCSVVCLAGMTCGSCELYTGKCFCFHCSEGTVMMRSGIR